MEITEEATKILVAMRDQQWLIAATDEDVVVISPVNGETFVIPAVFLTAPYKVALRHVLLDLVIEGMLAWPWPPNRIEGVHGEQPFSG
ncbi:hypothetical protein ALI144C_44900 [Actinosynnema sp. ALI-1.44]|uniref:hypothetical protein n=1 Tax=Actinosynnema sp. ALI-1.44 TaxID=1933779 RepID=UPI00097C3347|nr:hypothetical protein [Actinosynnema sp. ALI-1.44]ONI73092.1 hypothetical protein ALI144C_44900 [Actinosynnema sp. ALI-1.44]